MPDPAPGPLPVTTHPASWLAHRLRTTPQAPALRAFPTGETWSYEALAEAARRGAGRLAAAGVGAGDRVAVVGGDATGAIGQAIALHAVTWAGAVAVPIHAALGAEERGAQLEAVEARLLVAEPAALEAAGGLPPPCPLLDLAELLAAPAGGPPPAPRELSALHSILFTSGTTGRPTPVELTDGNHLASATASAFNLGIAAGDDWLCPLPLAHAGGLAVLLRSVLYGTAATLPAAGVRLDAERLADRLLEGGTSHLSLVPTQLRRLAGVLEARRTAPGALGRLRAVLVGGGPAAAADLERAEARGLPAVFSYGMTETASQVAAVPLARRIERPGAAGPALFGARLEVRGDGDRPAAPGESGEIHVAGPMVSAAAARASGAAGGARWLATGDFGRLDGDGWLWVEARRGDRIVTGGENVDPAEVEAVLAAHPEVAAAAVVGLDDPEWGQRVAAVVVAAPGAAPAPEALERFCRERLAPFKVPRAWRRAETLPVTPSGKVARRRLRELFAGG